MPPFPLELGGILNDWVIAPDVDGYRAADPREIVSAAVSGIERYELPDTIREDYLSAYEGDRSVESMRYVRAYPTELPILAELLPQIETPVEIIGGPLGTGRCHRATTGISTSGCPRASSI